MQNNTDGSVATPVPTIEAIETLRSPLDNVIYLSDWLAGQLPWRRGLVRAVKRRVLDSAA